MIGHSTMLVEVEGMRVIVDPFFAPSLMSISRRTVPPSLTAEQAAQRCDLVLVTHNHPDHCDPAFFDALPAETPVLVPDGFRFLGRYEPPQRITPLAEWASEHFDGLEVTCTPAAHPGVACGFVLAGDGRSLYLAGDTNPAPFFASVRDRLAPQTAALPLKNFRLGPGMTAATIGDAVTALGVSRVIGIHVHLVMKSRLLSIGNPESPTREALSAVHPDVEFVIPAPGDVLSV